MGNDRKHTPFLKVVADHYNNCDKNISNYCFVFPNRRSSRFFQNYLEEGSPKVRLQPHITTITDFVTDITGDIAATPIESIFSLYQAYLEISGNEDYEFDKFIFWGNIILSDFNDVDMYMVDAQQLFTNTKELREIATDFLSPELKEAIERYFNVKFDPTDRDNDRFWKSIAHAHMGEGEVKKSYLKLWQQLFELYEGYRKKMTSQGLSYQGKMVKDAALKLKDCPQEELEFEKYIFVGFNVLSTSELLIFDSLHKKGAAEFCWDYNSPAFHNEHNKGTTFLNLYTHQFPSAIQEEEIEEFPQFDITGVPSHIGQAKYAFHVVDKLITGEQLTHVENAIDTAIVLPDEKLFMPLINSVSEKVPNINVTLGYPLRDSDIASLMRIVSNMHHQATKVKEEYRYYREHVKNVLSHPIIKSLFTEASTQVNCTIDNENLFNVPESYFKDLPFEELFITIKANNNKDEVLDYLNRIDQFVEKVQQLSTQAVLKAEDAEEQGGEMQPMPLQSAFMKQYREVLYEIKCAIVKYGIPMNESSVFYLIDRLTSLYTIPFQGEPLAGLQVMGVLETRCLDFKNVIILSMNERVFPRKFFSSSFIPTNLRRAFRMSTIEHQESMTAYYFYRLISRAENVYMLYDSSTQSIGSGEYSRFIGQLKLIYGCNMKEHQLSLKIRPAKSLKVSIPKQGSIAKSVEEYRNPDGKNYLSASSIKEYIKCPLKFYFHHIEGLNDEKEASEFMDAATFGSIVHDTLQQLYYPTDKLDKNGHYIVTKSMLETFKKNELEKRLIQNVKRLYLRQNEQEIDTSHTPLSGETAILIDPLKKYASNVIDHDMSLIANENGYIEIYECEKDHLISLKTGDKQAFNFKYKADRIDRINGTGPLRIIDYKTGKDLTKINDMSKLTDHEEKKNVLAILQLFLYCNAYKQEHPEEETIQPVIYSLRDMEKTGIFFNAQEIQDFQGQYEGKGKATVDINAEFLEAVNSLMNEFFSTDQAFTQCKEDSITCNYCNFVEFCRR